MIQDLFIKQYITNYKKRGKTYLLSTFLQDNNLSKENIILQMLILCDKEYFNNVNTDPLLTDNEYDILREFANELIELKKDYTKLYNYLNFNVGAVITNITTKKKISLPYEIRSLNKIKNDQKALTDWSNKYLSPAEYIITPKLDGISGLYTINNNGESNLYTRGSGTVGFDISDFIPIKWF
jgi:NAD-dependent DNA ligase